MAGRIYLKLSVQSELTAMDEVPYDAEKTLQMLLARYPDLLAGEQFHTEEPRRWLLVAREMPVPAVENGSSEWYLDHLFLDQDGVLTLVEVKRSNNNQLRRAVIGQLLDYAANGVANWTVKHVQSKFEESCRKFNKNPEEVLAEFLGENRDEEMFWQQVKANLLAGRIRIVFVSDAIPPKLRRVVEFLNEQMDPAEVLAIEVKQFCEQGSTNAQVKVFVPQVIGQNERTRQKKAVGDSSEGTWNEESFMKVLGERKGEATTAVAKSLLDWITPRVTEIWWQKSEGRGIVPIIRQGQDEFRVCRIASQGWFAFRFDWLFVQPPFTGEAIRRELLARVNEIPNVNVEPKRARIQLDTLQDPAAMEKLKAVVAWLIEQVLASKIGKSEQSY